MDGTVFRGLCYLIDVAKTHLTTPKGMVRWKKVVNFRYLRRRFMHPEVHLKSTKASSLTELNGWKALLVQFQLVLELLEITK